MPVSRSRLLQQELGRDWQWSIEETLVPSGVEWIRTVGAWQEDSMGRVKIVLGVATAGIATSWAAWQSFRLGRASKK